MPSRTSVAVGLALGQVWLLSLCREATEACDVGGMAFLGLLAGGTTATTLLISVPVARRLVFGHFEDATRALWRYLAITVGVRFLFVIPPLWVLALFDLAVVDTLFPPAPGGS